MKPTRTLLLLSAVLAVGLCSAAMASVHLDRSVSAYGVHGHAHGCSASRFGIWHWRGTVVVRGRTLTYRWTENVRPDGRGRRLQYQSIGGTFLRGLSRVERSAIVGAVIRELNRTRVRYLGEDSPPVLHYNGPFFAGNVPFRPRPGC